LNGQSSGPPPVLYKEENEVVLPLDVASDAKILFTDLNEVAFENFLETGATLELPHSSRPVISIVLVLFNRAELTLACLRSIVENCSEELEVIIVDNASSDQTGLLLERLRGAQIIKNTSNRHFLQGANQGAQTSRGDYILLLNNDAQLLPGALQSALRTIRNADDIGAIGGKIILLDGTLQEAGSIVWRDGSCTGYGRDDDPLAPMYNFRRDVDYCSAAFLLTPRQVWERLGGFDRAYEPAYYEETDYCLRLWEHGLRVVYEPNAAILHYEFASAPSAVSVTGLQTRHQEIFAQRHRSALAQKGERSVDELLRARCRNADKRVLFIDDRVPHPWFGSGFPRAHAMQVALRRLGYFVTLYPLSFIDETWDQVYSDFPREIEVMMNMGREMLEPFLRIREGYYTSIIISRPHNMEYMAPLLSAHPEWFENVNVIYDAEAVFTEREIGLRKLAGTPMSDNEIRSALESEIRLTTLADSILAVSEKDRQSFRSHGIEHVHLLGHPAEPVVRDVPFSARQGILFVGAVHEEKSPNGDSLIWFLSEIYPRIQQALGEIPMTIAGIIKSERIRDLAGQSVRITGHLPSLEDLFATSRVFVAPTRYSAGVPIKIYEAAAHGVPVVATPLLASQLGWTARELAIAESAEAFAAQVIETYTNAATWAGLRDAALDRVRRECSVETFEDKLAAAMDATFAASSLDR
jgi:GT2 family glycosyltransferase